MIKATICGVVLGAIGVANAQAPAPPVDTAPAPPAQTTPAPLPAPPGDAASVPPVDTTPSVEITPPAVNTPVVAPPSAYDTCMAQRKRISEEAAHTANLEERARRYQGMPECHHDSVVTPPLAAVVPAPTIRPEDIPEIKSPTTAIALGLGTTAAGYALVLGAPTNHAAVDAGAVFAIVGPSTGHLYAGEFWSAGLGIRLAGLGVGAVGISMAFDEGNHDGLALYFIGGLIYLGGSIYEIATAGEAARAYNRKAAGYKLVPIAAPNAGGVSLVGRF